VAGIEEIEVRNLELAAFVLSQAEEGGRVDLRQEKDWLISRER
jgi:hypothetical protein